MVRIISRSNASTVAEHYNTSGTTFVSIGCLPAVDFIISTDMNQSMRHLIVAQYSSVGLCGAQPYVMGIRMCDFFIPSTRNTIYVASNLGP
jgi:hypothetical protein